ncbi:MAG TPA: FHA domain-containing protein [Dermatophilaceae bacterium]|nr:FHA domain-containing protein [Dermatophilaceae bacterium]
MGELTLTVLRLGLLALLWIFVFSIVGVLRSDLFGTRVRNRAGRRRVTRATRTPAAVAAGAAGSGAAGAAAAAGSADPAGQPRTPPTPPRGGWARGIPRSLVVTEGRMAGTSLPLTGSAILIGRNPECALVLDDDFASGRHARLHLTGGSWHVEDLGSTNGTYLDGQKLTEDRPIAVGSTIRIGRTVLELQG